jgi:site-specific recombinase XerC
MTTELEALAEFLTGNRLSAPTLPWRLLRNEDIRVLKEWAGETLPAPAQKRLLQELRTLLYQPAEAEGEVVNSGVAPAALRTLRRRGGGVHVATRQARLLLESCDADDCAEARRDAAVIALLLLAGLRRKELTELQRGDYDEDDGRLKAGSKGRHARSVILGGESRQAIEAWLAIRGTWAGPLIAAISPTTGEPAMRGIAPPTINRLVAKRAAAAGCTGITPRDLRRRFLWQLQSASRESPRCRYYQDEDGQPAWVLAAMPLG